MRLRLVTAGVGTAWEGALVQACQDGQVPAEVVHRCYDLGDLLAVAATGRAEASLVAATTRWLDREALARLAAAGLAVVGVAGDEDAERRLRQLGVGRVALDSAAPGALVDLARAAAAADPGTLAVVGPETLPDGTGPPVAGIEQAPAEPVVELPLDGDPSGHTVVAVWGPKGAPGRTTMAVNLAFEAAALTGETLLVDADTYGGTVVQALGYLEDAPGLAWAARLASRGELDAPRLWQATRRAAPGGPRVLAGLPRAGLWTELRPSTWTSLLDLLRVAFPLTVVDLGFCLEEDEELLYDQVRFRRNAVTRLTLQQADLVVAVARADPVGLHDFIRAFGDLRELGVPAARLRTVVNQVRPGPFGGERSAEQVRAALHRYLGVEVSGFVPYDRAGLDAALLAGQALREARPGCPARQALAELADALFGGARSARAVRGRRRTAKGAAPAGPVAAFWRRSP